MDDYISKPFKLEEIKLTVQRALEQKKYQGMGTTVVVLLVTPKMIIAANVGDSRIYLVRDGEVEKLSKDHSIVAEQIEMGMMTEEEAANSSMKHILTRNLGSAIDVEPDIFELEPSNNGQSAGKGLKMGTFRRLFGYMSAYWQRLAIVISRSLRTFCLISRTHSRDRSTGRPATSMMCLSAMVTARRRPRRRQRNWCRCGAFGALSRCRITSSASIRPGRMPGQH
jgi:hypothetical protein